MGNAPLWKALQERDALYDEAARQIDRQRRHAPRRTRRNRRRRGRLHGGSRRRRFCSTAWTWKTRCTNARWANCRAGRKCACCWRKRSSASRPSCCWTSRPTTWTSIRCTGCRNICCEYEGVLIVISHDRHFLNSVCTHTADIDYQTVIMYNGGYDDMVVAKTSIRSRIESRKRAARKENRATERIHRAIFGRHALLAGDVAQEGSGAAADRGAGEIQHRAAVHSVSDGPALRGGIRWKCKSVDRSPMTA